MFFSTYARRDSDYLFHDGARPTVVLLVSTFSNKHGGAISESLGPEAIAGHLIGTFGTTIAIDHIDLQLDQSARAIAAKVARDRPSLVGISVKIGALDQLRNLMRLLLPLRYDEGTGPLLVLGGVVPTFATAALLEEFPQVIMVVREGENATAALVDY
ncbi:cobalamin B12-binding domain-containing protein, partial [Leclercia adecarboxylata]